VAKRLRSNRSRPKQAGPRREPRKATAWAFAKAKRSGAGTSGAGSALRSG